MRRFAKLLVVVALAAGTMHVAGAAPMGRCPKATTCALYSLRSDRWKLTRGVARIHYEISEPQPWLTHQQLRDAAQAAEAAWERATSGVDFVFDGISTDVPQLGNGVNEIAFVPTLEPDVIAQTNHRMRNGAHVESDTLLNVTKPWSWTPCTQEHGSCSDAFGAGVRMLDLQAALTQQLGHWLGLESIDGAAGLELTMSEAFGYGQRHHATLALGDILGVRRAYPPRPCRCPAPAVFLP